MVLISNEGGRSHSDIVIIRQALPTSLIVTFPKTISKKPVIYSTGKHVPGLEHAIKKSAK